MPPTDALHMKAMFYEDVTSWVSHTYLDAYVKSVQGYDYEDAKTVPAPGTFMKDTNGTTLIEHFRNLLKMSETFYVSKEMMQVAMAAATHEDFPAEEGIRKEDMPAPFGFMLFERPIREADIRGRMIAYNAVMWSTVGNVIEIYWLTDKYEDMDEVNQLLRSGARERGLENVLAQAPRLLLSHTNALESGGPLPQRLQTLVIPPDEDVKVKQDENGAWRIDLSQYSIGPNMTAWQEDDVWSLPDEAFSVSASVATLVTIWLLMGQTIVDVREETKFPKAVNRLTSKLGFVDQKVSVIELRKYKGSHQGSKEVEWSHRWLRRGHWRNQWYASEDRHRKIWIHPTICGPDDKPLLIRDHVNALIR